MKYSFYSASNIGKIRKINQDFFLNSEVNGGHVFVLCDGMGGHLGGEVASQIAAKSVVDFIKSAKTDEIQSLMNEAFYFAHQNIINESKKDISLNGMGTTICSVIAYNEKFLFGHVGDSRIYSVFDKKINCLTKDHSLVQKLIDSGELSEQNASHHPMRNIITSALGTSFDSSKNYCDGVLFLPKDAYLLICSDGLNGMISDSDILSTFSFGDPETIANTLVGKALDAGGNDNITVSVIKVNESSNEDYSIYSNSGFYRKASKFRNLYSRITNNLCNGKQCN
jgi:protein phosphatase